MYRGVRVERTSQLNFGGNTDFFNMLERERLVSKKISKTDAVRSQLGHELPADAVHIGPSDYVPWLEDRKWAHIRLEGRGFGDQPINIELKLEVWDSPNSAGVVIDAIRACKVALARRIGRPLRWLVRVSCAYPAVTVVGALGLAVVSVLYTLTTLTFQTSNLGLMPPGQPYVERYRQYDREFGELDDLAIVVEAPSLPEATLYARRLVRELRAARVPLARIAYRIDPKPFEGRALYYLSEDERLLFILVEPESERGSFTGDRRAIEGVRAVIRSLRAEFPDVEVGVTGKPALSNDEMTAAFRDSERATLLAFALTLGLLLAAFLRFGRPLLMLLVLTMSLCWALGIATLVIGHLSLFSVMFISIVIGIGIDYGIYFLFRYEEELFLGRSLREAIEITATRSGPGMLLGAVTAAGTFYVLCLTEFRGVQELGFIAGTAILLSWVATMTVFPATLVLLDHRHARRPSGTIPRALALERVHVPLVERIMTYPKTVLVFAVLLTGVSAWGLKYIQFDYNLLHLQASGTESVVWERKILAIAGRSGFTALASADSLEELRRKHAAFGRLPTVSGVDSALLLIPDDQPEKLKIVRDFAPIVAQVRIGRAPPVDLDRLIAAFETLKRRFDIAGSEAPEGEDAQKLRDVSAAIERLVIKVRQTDPDVSESALTYLQTQIYNDFVRNFQRLQANLSPRPIGLKDIPPELRRKFTSEQGRFLLHIQPAVDIWDREGALRFVTELRSVDPEVTSELQSPYDLVCRLLLEK